MTDIPGNSIADYSEEGGYLVTQDEAVKNRNVLLQKALEIAVKVHSGQVDFSGLPIIFHVLRVFNHMDTPEEQLVALLHDVVEDGGFRIVGDLDETFSETVVGAVLTLTRRKGEDYLNTYIQRVIQNPLAARVKLADLEDNMNLGRLPSGFVDQFIPRLRKYQRAKEMILENIQLDKKKNPEASFSPRTPSSKIARVKFG